MSALRPCNDCGADPGQNHTDGCDVARCMRTGQQRIQCDDCDHCENCTCEPCPPDVWTGEWPGVAECREFGWWCFFVPNGNPSWVRCRPDHPDAQPDLTRLITEATWIPEERRWVRARLSQDGDQP